MIHSHDPRMNRLGLPDAPASAAAKAALDQFPTYEVFHQKKDGAAYVYVGPVHAPEDDVAFLFAKEQYSRRFACTGDVGGAHGGHHRHGLRRRPGVGLRYAATQGHAETGLRNLKPNQPTTRPLKIAAYAAGEEDYDIFHLKKRGKAHQHIGKVRASSPGRGPASGQSRVWRAAAGGECVGRAVGRHPAF